MAGTNRLTGPERRDLLAGLLALRPRHRVETARDGYLFVRAGRRGGRALLLLPLPAGRPLRGLAARGGLGRRPRADEARRDHQPRHPARLRRPLPALPRLPLAELLDAPADKFGHVRDFPLQALKGLADLSQVEGEPMPRLARPLAVGGGRSAGCAPRCGSWAGPSWDAGSEPGRRDASIDRRTC